MKTARFVTAGRSRLVQDFRDGTTSCSCSINRRSDCGAGSLRLQSRPALEVIDAGIDQALVEGVDILAATQIAEHQHGQLASQMLAEFLETLVDPAPALVIAQVERVVPDQRNRMPGILKSRTLHRPPPLQARRRQPTQESVLAL